MAAETTTRTVPAIGAAQHLATALARVRRRRLTRRPGRAASQRPGQQSVNPGRPDIDVSTAILSHLHQDHIGGLPLLTSSDRSQFIRRLTP
jgi:ribonuclease BN (tRNA processing enzyme)